MVRTTEQGLGSGKFRPFESLSTTPPPLHLNICFLTWTCGVTSPLLFIYSVKRSFQNALTTLFLHLAIDMVGGIEMSVTKPMRIVKSQPRNMGHRDTMSFSTDKNTTPFCSC